MFERTLCHTGSAYACNQLWQTLTVSTISASPCSQVSLTALHPSDFGLGRSCCSGLCQRGQVCGPYLPRQTALVYPVQRLPSSILHCDRPFSSGRNCAFCHHLNLIESSSVSSLLRRWSLPAKLRNLVCRYKSKDDRFELECGCVRRWHSFRQENNAARKASRSSHSTKIMLGAE